MNTKTKVATVGIAVGTLIGVSVPSEFYVATLVGLGLSASILVAVSSAKTNLDDE